MASPPFNISQDVPADDDFVSPFPNVERNYRDIVESWFLIDGNNMGRSNKRSFDWQGSAPTPVASVTQIWADDAQGDMLIQRGTSSPEYLGVPTGTVLEFAGATAPAGYLLCYGQEVSRSTYAVLFAVIGTTHGVGNGTTTFNLPDYRGRVGVGKDDMGGSAANRITSGGSGINGTTLGAVGGAETHTLTVGQIPSHSHTATVTDPGHSHPFPNNPITGSGGGVPVGTSTALWGTISNTSNATTGITVSNSNTGSGNAHNNTQPTIIINK